MPEPLSRFVHWRTRLAFVIAPWLRSDVEAAHRWDDWFHRQASA